MLGFTAFTPTYALSPSFATAQELQSVSVCLAQPRTQVIYANLLPCVVVALVCLPVPMAIAKTDGLCAPLRSFVESVAAEQTKTFKFHTIWGGNFKDEEGRAIYSKRCRYFDYGPADTVCKYLMDHGAVEFSDNNFKRVVACLSPKTRFAPNVSIQTASVSFIYGSDRRGADISVKLSEDEEIGGVVLEVKAEGYGPPGDEPGP
jgi:hypothetical protein